MKMTAEDGICKTFSSAADVYDGESAAGIASLIKALLVVHCYVPGILFMVETYPKWNHKTYLPPFVEQPIVKEPIANDFISARMVTVKLLVRIFHPFVTRTLESFNCLSFSHDSDILETGIEFT